MKRSLVGCVALASIFAGSAMAADMVKAPPRAVYSDWTGFYIGIHGGYGWGHVNSQDDFFAPFPNDPNPKGGLVGGHAGYLWQWGAVVGGLEIDYSATGIKEDQTIVPPDNLSITETISSKIDALGSARARLGWLWTPNILAYGTAGIGLAHSSLSDSFSISQGHSSAESSFGWVVGAGLEYQFATNWRLRAEYLHYDFGTVTYLGGANVDLKVDVVRGGLSFKF